MANLTGAATTHDSSVGNGATNYSPETPPPNRGLSSTGTPLSLQHDRQDNRIKNENPLRYEHQTSTPCTSPTNCQLPEFSIVSTISTTYIKRARVDRRRFVLEQEKTAKNKKPLRGPLQLIAVHARTDRVSTARRACSFQKTKKKPHKRPLRNSEVPSFFSRSEYSRRRTTVATTTRNNNNNNTA